MNPLALRNKNNGCPARKSRQRKRSRYAPPSGCVSSLSLYIRQPAQVEFPKHCGVRYQGIERAVAEMNSGKVNCSA